jgi:hypothetical protein
MSQQILIPSSETGRGSSLSTPPRRRLAVGVLVRESLDFSRPNRVPAKGDGKGTPSTDLGVQLGLVARARGLRPVQSHAQKKSSAEKPDGDHSLPPSGVGKSVWRPLVGWNLESAAAPDATPCRRLSFPCCRSMPSRGDQRKDGVKNSPIRQPHLLVASSAQTTNQTRRGLGIVPVHFCLHLKLRIKYRLRFDVNAI